MKNSHFIISQLKNTQIWSKLKEYDEISKLINSLPIEVRKYIAFAHKKKQILLVALKNPNLCSEFNTYTAPVLLNIIASLKMHFSILASIKEIKSYFPQSPQNRCPHHSKLLSKDELQNQLRKLKTYRQRRELIQTYQKEGSLYFDPPKHTASLNEWIETFFLQTYHERSDGEFEIHSQNLELTILFKSIRETIKNVDKS